jgi:hypothetical protein
MATPPNLYALLIGIDCYMPNRLPDGSSYKNLGGCVRDIRHVAAFLQEVQQVPANQIFILTASPSPSNPQTPIEEPEVLPTRDNMVNAFRTLGKIAPSGSQVYIHYSGHGGRAKTVFEDIKGTGEIDEGLVPTDIGTSEGQYLRDLELAHLLQELSQQGLTVTLVLDCCHSGGATRGDVEIRGIEGRDDKPLQSDYQPVATPAELRNTWLSLTGSGTRGLTAGGLPESDRYVVLAACRQNEYAYEYAFNRETKERSGALTYWLLDTLRMPNPGQTYKDLYDRINAQIHSQFPSQTPLLLGAGDRVIFGEARAKMVFSIPVMSVERTEAGEMQAVLAIGQANGVTKGAEFAIYPRGATDLVKKEGRVAIARIIQRGTTDSICQLVAIEGKEIKVEAGDQAVQIAVSQSLVRKVALLPQDADAATQQALDAIKGAMPRSGQGWIEWEGAIVSGDNGEGIDYFVEVNAQGEYEIRDSGGALLKNMTPVLRTTDPGAPAQVVSRLIHLSKYRSASAIENADLDSPLAGKLALEWLGSSDTYELGDPMPAAHQMQKLTDPTKPTVKAGNTIFLSMRNQSPEPLNVAVLNFSADWSVTQVLPKKRTENFLTLEPGKEEKLPLQISMEGDGSDIENMVKVFATKGQANFRWLELPSLDEKQLVKDFVTRSVNPLDALLAAIGGEQPVTRKLTVAASPSRDWTMQQLMLTITK